MYEKRASRRVGWGEIDFNSHIKNTAFFDKSTDMTMMFVIENGFPTSKFARLRVGPMILKD